MSCIKLFLISSIFNGLSFCEASKILLLQACDHFFDALKCLFLTDYLHNGVKVGRIHLARYSYAYKHTDIGNTSLEGGRISLVRLHVGSESKLVGDSLDLLKPSVHVVGVVVRLGELDKSILDIVLINRMLVEWSGYENYGLSSVADVNRDGVVNVLDSTILARHIAGWSDYAVLPLN